MKLNLLVLDDEKHLREEMCEFLTAQDYHVFGAASPAEAFAILDERAIELAIVDINLPQKSGLDVLKEIKQTDPNIEVIIITGQGDMDKAIQALRLGAADFFNKPLRLSELLKAIERTKRYISLSKQYSTVKQSFESLRQKLFDGIGLNLVGISSAMNKVAEGIQTAALHPDLPVLVTGESGTGKELVARSIHYLSTRKSYLFHAVNCAAIPENLFESEFFGYVKGAFTGAIASKQGWFEMADKGSLFLDEIGDMMPTMQAKLLRVVEDGIVRRLGSNRDQTVNVRIISATNQEIISLVKEGRFRRDLYHRINGFQIQIPPLRERTEDIPVLSEYFIKSFSTSTGKRITGIEDAALDCLLKYKFPGNVRELKNMLERAMILCERDRLSLKHFCFDHEPLSAGTDDIYAATESLDLEMLEKRSIEAALLRTGYNKLQAAKLLNVSWQSLTRRMQKHGLKH